jgi:ABC-type transport system substrate-binding protein
MKRLLALFIVAALAGAALAQAPASAPTPEPQRKVLRVAFKVAETGFDPAKINDLYSRTVTPHIFESPYAFDPLANPVKIRPLTAAAMPEVSPDFRTWTVRIQPGIYFAADEAFKGKKRELVAQDYVYTYKRIVDPANKSPVVAGILEQNIVGLRQLYDDAVKSRKPFDYDREIEGMQAIDRYTLRFKLEKPRPRFLDVLAAPDLFGAVAREVAEYYGENLAAHPVGTGPFRLKQWRRSSLIVLERNPDYRPVYYDGTPAPDDAEAQALLKRLKGRRLPMVDEVQISIIEENQPRWLAFLNGETDMIGTIAAPLPEDFVNIAIPGGKLAPNLAKRGITVHRTLNADQVVAFFNMEDPVVGGYTPDKVALRRAIGLAYDTEREIRLVRRGQGVPAQSRSMPHTSGYDPHFKSEMSEFSPARAKALLDLYGYVDRDGDGWREMPDGSPLVLRMLTQPDGISRQVSQEWQHDMAAVGLRINFQVAQWPENLKAARAGKVMMWQLGSSAAGPDGQDTYAAMYSPYIGGQNFARFRMPEVDAMFDRMSEMEDGPERDALFLKMKMLQAAYMPYKTVMHRISNDLVHPWLIGFRHPVFWTEWWHMVDIDTDLRAKMLQKR